MCPFLSLFRNRDQVPFVLTFTYPFITQQIFIKRNGVPCPVLAGEDKEMKMYSSDQQGPHNLIGETAVQAINCRNTLRVLFPSFPTSSPVFCMSTMHPQLVSFLHSTAHTWVQAPVFPSLDELLLLPLSSLQFLSPQQPEGSLKECKSDHVTTLLNTSNCFLLNWKKNSNFLHSLPGINCLLCLLPHLIPFSLVPPVLLSH